MYLINGNFLLQYTIYIIYRFLFLYYILYWQSFKDQSLRFFRKRVQNYCFFATWPNFLEDFLNYLRNSLILSTHFFGVAIRTSFSISQNTPSFFAKADAKVLLFYDITKSLHDYLVNRDTLQKKIEINHHISPLCRKII